MGVASIIHLMLPTSVHWERSDKKRIRSGHRAWLATVIDDQVVLTLLDSLLVCFGRQIAWLGDLDCGQLLHVRCLQKGLQGVVTRGDDEHASLVRWIDRGEGPIVDPQVVLRVQL